ncbi:MAG: hypothetical protein PHQ91_00295 [Thermoanaerobaculaceae bacterium]|nr:hypothetical protein [Thermoanaerobaculaceae bacterium]TAM56902.1 MAG: hypothetical protein EPN53_00425 [Acidobacteriota bacterium]
MSSPQILLLASPDDFLLELARQDAVAAWQQAHPDGEVVPFGEAPPATRLVQELASPSLFVAERLLVVADARPYLSVGRRAAADPLAASLEALPLAGVALVMSAVAAAAPTGALADAVGRRGEVRFIGLPDAPKPWDEARVSREQRQALVGLIARVAPALQANHEVVDALCEAYGFRPRELAKAAERLALAGEADAAAVRAQAGAGERQLREIEDALQRRDGGRFARFTGAIAAGAVLLDWRGDAVGPDRLGPILTGTVGRLLRQALAVRGYAARAALAAELDPRRCAGKDWYQRAFKPRLFPRLAKEIEATPDSPIAGMTPWQLHRAFRLAAAYEDGELIAALARLAESRAERARGPAALAAISALVLALIGRPAAPSRRTAPAA